MITRRGFILGTAAAGTLAAVGVPFGSGLLEPGFANEHTVGNHARGMVPDDVECERLTGTIVDIRYDMSTAGKMHMQLTIRLDDGRIVQEVYAIGRPS